MSAAAAGAEGGLGCGWKGADEGFEGVGVFGASGAAFALVG